MAPAMELAIGVSEYDRRELEEAGYARTAHVPILIDWHAYDTTPDDAVMARWDGVRPLLLFVGRVSPHKRQDDLIRMLAYYRACIDPNARLVLVGGYRDQPQYHARLVELVKALHLEPAVTFAGPVSTAELVAYFRSASAFVSLSEHEGFGVPLLEAMRFDVPVIAYDAAAVGETVDGAGVLLKDRDLAQAAEAVGLVLERPALREQLVAAGRERLNAFDPDRVALRTREVLGL
jgi:glycosyltransferase involved in cell wall biosynthesis